MLFEKVAIDPDLLLSEDLVNLLRYKFVWSEGRFVAELPENWIDRALMVANTLPDGPNKIRLKKLLQVRNIPTINIAMQGMASHEWVQQAHTAKESKCVSSVLCNTPTDSVGWFGSDRLDSYIDLSSECIGYLDIKGLYAKEIVSAVDVFIETNKHIVLVNPDQWLRVGKSKDLFAAFFARWSNSGGSRFTVVRSKRYLKAFTDRDWSNEREYIKDFLTSVKYRGYFNFIAVNDEIDRLHERYLIGDRHGIKLGYGLELSRNKSHPWTLMKESEHTSQKRRFMDNDIRDSYKDNKFMLPLRGK